MSLSESKIFQSMTAGAQFVRESVWAQVYESRNHQYYVSKFLDENFSVDSLALRQQWPEMGPSMRAEFCCAFAAKVAWTANDTEILDVIMQDGDDGLWATLALTFLRHPDRDRVVKFLIARLQDPLVKHGGGTLNYFQALGIAGDRRAASAIKPFYDEYKKGLEVEATTGVPQDVAFGPIPYHAYFAAAGAMLKTDGSPEYEEGIRCFLNHPNEQVSYWAEHALGIEGPITKKRNREHRPRNS